MDWLTQENLSAAVSATLASQVTQFGIAFALAAHIHASKMKKEIANQMGQVVDAINNLGRDLRKDMADQAKRIETVESEVKLLKQPK